MTPWHRFWFPHGDEDPTPSRDAALWTPEALADTQRALWQHAAQAAEQWWRFWQLAWPALPSQPPVGVVLPPPPAERAAAPVSAAPAVQAPSRRAAPATGKGRAAGQAATRPPHPHRGARHK